MRLRDCKYIEDEINGRLKINTLMTKRVKM